MTTSFQTRPPFTPGFGGAPYGSDQSSQPTEWARYSDQRQAGPAAPSAAPAANPSRVMAAQLSDRAQVTDRAQFADRVQVVGRGSDVVAAAESVEQRRNGMGFDQARYWVGSALTAVVAALVGIVSLTIVNGVLHRRVIDVDTSSSYGVHIGAYGLIAALVAIGMSMLFVAIAHFAPRPALYFGWIGGLGVLLAVVLPFTNSLPLLSQAIFAGINALVGAVIVIMVPLAVVRER